MTEIFTGHLEQIDFDDDGRVTALHLRGRDGAGLILTIGRPETDSQAPGWEWQVGSRSRPLAFLNRDARPPVTIEREGRADLSGGERTMSERMFPTVTTGQWASSRHVDPSDWLPVVPGRTYTATIRVRNPGGTMSEPRTEPTIYYVLACLECGDPDEPLLMPFESAAARGKWAAEHTRATGHARWYVKDEQR